MARVYFERARSKPDISLLGTPVQRLPYDDDKNVEGVILEADTPRKPSSPPEPGQVVSVRKVPGYRLQYQPQHGFEYLRPATRTPQSPETVDGLRNTSMPVDIEAAIREELREIFPTVADRPPAKT
ncbi:uncharacterized protein ASPGLDRAFT_35412 [Aspergillus glaucus CBS 516.65]|uniref:Uncharacterized protein n=1 Tax=Aspergillus glaucus CBS 516.65 TaxID=1160497 RepID=A0A1L9VJM0_ASPGL|nr:hypothetical protein ASPGLDRAFT_35412 [Aspergillus glaucus CBS 516.65]OJJ84126.1 hypothetical protein ASPGLDRAFT_35412 [Aspergillus glaucus CBS 516.65]